MVRRGLDPIRRAHATPVDTCPGARSGGTAGTTERLGPHSTRTTLTLRSSSRQRPPQQTRPSDPPRLCDVIATFAITRAQTWLNRAFRCRNSMCASGFLYTAFQVIAPRRPSPTAAACSLLAFTQGTAKSSLSLETRKPFVHKFNRSGSLHVQLAQETETILSFSR